MNIKDILRKAHVKYLRMRSPGREPNFGGKVLIVAPHPDDEVIGCGGLIARLVEQGNPPQIIVMTGGEGSHGNDSIDNKSIVKARRSLTRDTLSILGVPESNLYELDFPDGGISAESEQLARLKDIIDIIQPDVAFVPHWGEGWPDHVNTAKIIKDLVPSTTQVWEYCVWIWYYNVWRGLDWKKAAAIRMTPEEQALKLQAMNAYICPLAPDGLPWSGVLPEIFIDANSGNLELYFKCGKI